MSGVNRKTFLASMLVVLVMAWAGAIPQDLRLEDVPATGLGLNSYASLPLQPLVRAELEKAVKSREYGRAENLLVQEIAKSPKSASLLTTLGVVFFLDGRYLQCAIAMKKAEAIAPLGDRNRFTLALVYVILNRVDWARPELQKLAAIDPQNPLYPYWLGRLDYDTMQFKAAVARFRRVVELNPHFMKGYDNLGLCYEALGQNDDAVRAYQEAMQLNREKPSPSPWPPLNLGTLLVKLGRLDEGKSALEEALRYNSRFPKAHYQMGLLLEKEKKDLAAIEELKLAANYDSTIPEPYYILGRIYQRLGDKQKADAAWSSFQKLKKRKPDERPR